MPNKEYRIKNEEYDYDITIEYYLPAGDIEICRLFNDPAEDNEIFNIDSVDELYEILKADPQLYQDISEKFAKDLNFKS